MPLFDIFVSSMNEKQNWILLLQIDVNGQQNKRKNSYLEYIVREEREEKKSSKGLSANTTTLPPLEAIRKY